MVELTLKDIKWHNLRDLPGYKHKNGSMNMQQSSGTKYFMVRLFLHDIQKWIIKNKKSVSKAIKVSSSAPATITQSSPIPVPASRPNLFENNSESLKSILGILPHQDSASSVDSTPVGSYHSYHEFGVGMATSSPTHIMQMQHRKSVVEKSISEKSVDIKVPVINPFSPSKPPWPPSIQTSVSSTPINASGMISPAAQSLLSILRGEEEPPVISTDSPLNNIIQQPEKHSPPRSNKNQHPDTIQVTMPNDSNNVSIPNRNKNRRRKKSSGFQKKTEPVVLQILQRPSSKSG